MASKQELERKLKVCNELREKERGLLDDYRKEILFKDRSLKEESQSICMHEIRNKLSTITHLISILTDERLESKKWLPEAIENVKRSINYLAQREVYSTSKNLNNKL